MAPRSVSPSQPEGKSANALAQARHRRKKKAHMQNLEEEVSRLKDDNEKLKEEIQKLRAQQRPSSSSSSSTSSKEDELNDLRRYVSQLESALPESHASRRPPSLYPMAPPSSLPPSREARRSSGASNFDQTSPSPSPPSSSSSRDRLKDAEGGRAKKRAAAPDWGDGLAYSSKEKGKERARRSESSEGGEGGGDKLEAIRSAWPSTDPKVLLALEKSASKSKSTDKGKGKGVVRKGSAGGEWEGVGSNLTSGPSSTATPNPSSSRPGPPNDSFPSAAPPQRYPVSPALYPKPDLTLVTLPNRSPPSSRFWTIPFPPPDCSRSSKPQPQPAFDSVDPWGGPGRLFLPPEGGDEARAERERVRKEWRRGLVNAAAVRGEVLPEDQEAPSDAMDVERE
ncbi:hypothetical protein BDY24DRAFT_372760 [Mrakia frigida]|uniref:uncharacterized protein n=1 Tax=Mrakia frigida TaxID=29902 RepID=UPI003FCC0064